MKTRPDEISMIKVYDVYGLHILGNAYTKPAILAIFVSLRVYSFKNSAGHAFLRKRLFFKTLTSLH